MRNFDNESNEKYDNHNESITDDSHYNRSNISTKLKHAHFTDDWSHINYRYRQADRKDDITYEQYRIPQFIFHG